MINCTKTLVLSITMLVIGYNNCYSVEQSQDYYSKYNNSNSTSDNSYGNVSINKNKNHIYKKPKVNGFNNIKKNSKC